METKLEDDSPKYRWKRLVAITSNPSRFASTYFCYGESDSSFFFARALGKESTARKLQKRLMQGQTLNDD